MDMKVHQSKLVPEENKFHKGNGDDGDMSHDAAAAQAYKQALDEYESAEDGQANIIAALIKRRANAIFREWGFDSGEDAGDE